MKPGTLARATLVVAAVGAFFTAYPQLAGCVPHQVPLAATVVRVQVVARDVDLSQGGVLRDRFGKEWPLAPDCCVEVPSALGGTVVQLLVGAERALAGEGTLDLDNSVRLPRLVIR